MSSARLALGRFGVAQKCVVVTELAGALGSFRPRGVRASRIRWRVRGTAVWRGPALAIVRRGSSCVCGGGHGSSFGEAPVGYDIRSRVGGGGAGVSLSVSGSPVRPARCEQLRVRPRVRVLPLRRWMLRLQQARRRERRSRRALYASSRQLPRVIARVRCVTPVCIGPRLPFCTFRLRGVDLSGQVAQTPSAEAVCANQNGRRRQARRTAVSASSEGGLARPSGPSASRRQRPLAAGGAKRGVQWQPQADPQPPPVLGMDGAGELDPLLDAPTLAKTDSSRTALS